MKLHHKLAILFFGAAAIGFVLTPARIQFVPNVAEAEMSSPADMSSRYLPGPEIRVADVTAYSEIDSCHYEGCVMANGKRAEEGYAACPRDLPFGTKVVISGVIYECADRTAERYDGRFDIFFGYGIDSHIAALKHGIVRSEVEILR